jgi:hypothetical protein
MSELNQDLSNKWIITEALANAVVTATATQTTGADTQDWKRATVLVSVGAITGGGTVTLSLTSSDTVGGSYTAETSADVFVGGAPAAIDAAGIYAYDIKLGALDSRFIKVVLTEADTYSASTSATIVAESRDI